jgi:hypothetical protein
VPISFRISSDFVSLDLQSFREALAVLQRQVDDLDELKVSHYHEIIEHEEEVWDVVQSKVRPDLIMAI